MSKVPFESRRPSDGAIQHSPRTRLAHMPCCFSHSGSTVTALGNSHFPATHVPTLLHPCLIFPAAHTPTSSNSCHCPSHTNATPTVPVTAKPLPLSQTIMRPHPGTPAMQIWANRGTVGKGAWHDLFYFTLATFGPMDMACGNFFTSSFPESLFRKVCVK